MVESAGRAAKAAARTFMMLFGQAMHLLTVTLGFHGVVEESGFVAIPLPDWLCLRLSVYLAVRQKPSDSLYQGTSQT